jgi:hypothetical protein
MRIKTHSTLQSEKGLVINTSAQNWGQLKSEVSAAGVDLNGKSFTLRVGRGDTAQKVLLKYDSTPLPQADEGILFIYPEKVKSGIDADDYDSSRSGIKAMIEAAVDELKDFIEDKIDAVIEIIEDVADEVTAPSDGSDDLDDELDSIMNG